MSATQTRAEPGFGEILGTALREETPIWVFALKSLIAFYLTGWLAMRFALPQPSTAMMTTVIVANRNTGMVLAKSFYRAIGTVVGALVGFLIVAMFPQQRVLFLGAMSLWVGLCAGGATLHRNFKAYSFVLAGYTAAIVALPAINNPIDVFASAVARLSEVLLAIAVSAAVHDVLFPTRIRDDMRRVARALFADFISFVQRAMVGKVAREDIENAHLRFVRDAVTLEDLRSSAIFEDPEARARSGHMQQWNQRFMAVSTSLQTLHHLINRLKRGGHDVPADALIQLYHPLGEALDAPIEAGAVARVLLPRLAAARKQIHQHRDALREQMHGERDVLDFDTGAQLLEHFVDELTAYVETATALQSPQFTGSVERVRFERGNDYTGALLATVRTALTMAALSVFWLASAWPYGASAMLIATVFAGLFATTPNPPLFVRDTFWGYATGMLAGFVCVFGVLVNTDGFPLLVAGTAPFLFLGLVLMVPPSTTRFGVGYSMGFAYILAVRNMMQFDIVNFVNDVIAQLIGVGAAGMAFAFLPAAAGTGWWRRRQLDRLRRLVGITARAPLSGLRARFESLAHDLFAQIVMHTQRGSAMSREQIAWALSIHETGRSLIELRSAMTARQIDGETSGAIGHAIEAMAHVYEHPGAISHAQAVHTLDAATARAQRDPNAHSLLQYLHLLRLSLLDDQAALGQYMSTENIADGAPHAT